MAVMPTGTHLSLLVLAPLVCHTIEHKEWRLPPGKRMRAALCILPIALVLHEVLSVVLAAAILVAFLRRSVCPAILSHNQVAELAPPLRHLLLSSERKAEPDTLQPRLVPKEIGNENARHPYLPPNKPCSGGAVRNGFAKCVPVHSLGDMLAKCLQPIPVSKGGGQEEQGAALAVGNGDDDTVGVAAIDGPELSAAEQQRLARGQTVIKRTRMGDGREQGLAAQRIRAPAALVWSTLNDFERWCGMVDHCVGSEVYQSTGDLVRGEVKAKVTLGLAFLRVSAHCHHVLDRPAGRLTWTLDTTQPNDVVANEGFWLVRADPTDAGACVVFYSGVVVLAAWAPAWANTFLAEAGLPKAVGWIQREAERRAQLAVRAPPRPRALQGTALV